MLRAMHGLAIKFTTLLLVTVALPLLLTMAWAEHAWAQPKPHGSSPKGSSQKQPTKQPTKQATTIAIKIEGPKSDTFRAMIVELVPKGVEVLDDPKFKTALARTGLPGGNMGFALTGQRTRPTLLKLASRAVANEKLAGAVLGRVQAGRAGTELVLVYVEAEGEPKIDTKVSLKGKSDAQKAALKTALAPAFDELAPAAPEPEPEVKEQPKPEPADDEGKKEEEEEEEEEPSAPGEFKPNRFGSELFSIQLGVEFGGRFFRYSESPANSSNIRPYDVFGVPGIHVAGEIYPLATLDVIVASDIGLTVSYMHAFGLDSATKDERYVFGTNWNRFTAGLRYRFRIGDKDDNPFVIGVDGRFGFLNFTFDPESAEAPNILGEIAKVQYLFIRAGLDARLPIVSFFALAPSFGYVAPVGGVDSDDLPEEATAYERFTGAKVHGIDMELMLVFVLPAGFEARGGAEYMRFFSSFDPQVGEAYIAGGALDQYVSLRVGAAYVF